jgi:hypothetical protein
MTLREKQSKFVELVALLISEFTERGFALTFGEAWRSPQEAARDAATGAGIAHSLHTQRLAIDMNLFIDGQLQTDTAAYEPMGVWWEAQSRDGYTCCWGGRFSRPDGDHFSIEHEGVK